MPDELLINLPALAVPSNDDIIYIVDNPGGVPLDRQITYGNLTAPLALNTPQFVTMAVDAGLPNERVLTGTVNQVIVTDGGAGGNVVLSTPQDIHTGATPQFAGMTITGINGIDYNPVGDVDVDLVTVGVTGTPLLKWDESENAFDFSTIIAIPATTATVGQIKQAGANLYHSFGTRNIFIGPTAGNFTLTGTDNFGFGVNALNSVTTGSRNVAIGFSSMEDLTIANANVGVGSFTLANVISGVQNMAIGASALENLTTGQDNVGLGTRALNALTTGTSNMAIGSSSLTNLVGGINNVAIGTFSLTRCTDSSNVAVGFNSLGLATSAANNVGIGRSVGSSLTTGDGNVLLGFRAGDLLTTGGSNIIIGFNADPTANTASNELNIGGLIFGDLSADIAGVNVTPPSLAATWHVDQLSTTAAIPVLLLDQADVSEEMIEFVTTIGVGNAIEAVGAKVLTTTHFIKVTIPGGLTRYFPVGTIA